MCQFQIPLQEFARWSVGRARLKERKIPYLGVMIQLVANTAEVPDGREPALIEDVRRVRGDNELRVEKRCVIVGILKEAQNVPNEDLLDLRVQMSLRLLNEDQMQWRPFVFLGFPLLVQVEEFNHHID